jgi:hypothetical protein
MQRLHRLKGEVHISVASKYLKPAPIFNHKLYLDIESSMAHPPLNLICKNRMDRPFPRNGACRSCCLRAVMVLNSASNLELNDGTTNYTFELHPPEEMLERKALERAPAARSNLSESSLQNGR